MPRAGWTSQEPAQHVQHNWPDAFQTALLGGFSAQPLQLQRRMCRVLDELLISSAGGGFNFRRQRPVGVPKLRCPKRFHGRLSKSASRSSEKVAGLLLNCLAISSPRAESAGRGRASLAMRCHCKSPFNSGRMDGKFSQDVRAPQARAHGWHFQSQQLCSSSCELPRLLRAVKQFLVWIKLLERSSRRILR